MGYAQATPSLSRPCTIPCWHRNVPHSVPQGRATSGRGCANHTHCWVGRTSGSKRQPARQPCPTVEPSCRTPSTGRQLLGAFACLKVSDISAAPVRAAGLPGPLAATGSPVADWVVLFDCHAMSVVTTDRMARVGGEHLLKLSAG